VSVAQGAMIDGTMKIHDGNELVDQSDPKSAKIASNKSQEQLKDSFEEATSF